MLGPVHSKETSELSEEAESSRVPLTQGELADAATLTVLPMVLTESEADEEHPLLFQTVMVKVPVVSPEKEFSDCGVPPFREYVSPFPVGDVIEMLPLGSVQLVLSVTERIGVSGSGWMTRCRVST